MEMDETGGGGGGAGRRGGVEWTSSWRPFTWVVGVVECRSQYEDWRPHVACLLQPIPFPDE